MLFSRLVALFAIVICSVEAAAEERHVSGKILLGSSYTTPYEPYADSITRGATVGLNMTRYFEIGLHQSVNYAGFGDAEQLWDSKEIWTGRSGTFANIELPSSDGAVVPFVGAFMGLDYDEDDASAYMGPHAGAFAFLNDKSFLHLRYRYEWSSEQVEDYNYDKDADDGEHVISLGLGVTF